MRAAEHGGVAGLRVVVLGGTGYLGRRVGEAFSADGSLVRMVSRSPAPEAPVDPRFLTLDLLAAGPRELTGFFASLAPDTVVNAAGRVWDGDEAQMTAGNVELVVRVLESLAGLPRPPRLIQLGSIHEHGDGQPGVSIREEDEPAPATPYGRTKLLGTRAVQKAADGGVDGVVLRLANVIGSVVPARSLFGRVAAHLGAAARARSMGEEPQELRLPPLRVHRDIVDVDDVVEAVRCAATAPREVVNGQVINIGSGEAVSMRALIDRMVELSGLDVPVVETAPDHSPRSAAEWQCMDVSRAMRLLGWKSRRPLDASLRNLLAATVLVPANGRN